MESNLDNAEGVLLAWGGAMGARVETSCVRMWPQRSRVVRTPESKHSGGWEAEEAGTGGVDS